MLDAVCARSLPSVFERVVGGAADSWQSGLSAAQV
jgi:hypothetical protein